MLIASENADAISLAFSPDGYLLASGRTNGDLNNWGLDNALDGAPGTNVSASADHLLSFQHQHQHQQPRKAP